MKTTQNKKKKLRIAVPKGRILKDGLELLRKSGYIKHPDSDYDSRRLTFEYEDDEVGLLIVKPWDVPTFVEYGAADAGIAGKDVLLEKPKNVYEPLDLKIGKCKVVVAVRGDLITEKGDLHSRNSDYISLHKGEKPFSDIKITDRIKKNIYFFKTNIRVATKYVHITKDFFNKKGVSNIQIIKLYGNVELAPISGLCDFIVDLVSTGETLRQNNLVPVDDIAYVTSRFIVNRASLKINPTNIASMIGSLKEQVEKNADTDI
ncbi:MAG TPA: ATP phosphoribosyltransferase [bacterium]|nr:ATP phosphoribosyltransferase [bacterium]